MNHLQWTKNKPLKKVQCVHTKAKKYTVAQTLTEGKIYDVVNETDEFYFIIDNTNRIAGFYKEYFKEL